MESMVIVKNRPWTEREMPPATATLRINMGDEGESESAYFKTVKQIIDLVNKAGQLLGEVEDE